MRQQSANPNHADDPVPVLNKIPEFLHANSAPPSMDTAKDETAHGSFDAMKMSLRARGSLMSQAAEEDAQ